MPGSGEWAPRIDDYGLIADGHTDALVLCTTWRTATGRARVLDFLAACRDAPGRALRQLVRIVEGLDGEVELEAHGGSGMAAPVGG